MFSNSTVNLKTKTMSDILKFTLVYNGQHYEYLFGKN